MIKNNVLLVTYSFYPDGWGGMHIYVYNLAQHLKKSVHFCPHVLTIKTDPVQPGNEVINGIEITRFKTVLEGKFRFILRPLVSIVKSYVVFEKLNKQKHFSVINFHSVISAIGILLNQHSRKVKKIFTFHSSFYYDIVQQMKKKHLFPKILNSPVLFCIKKFERFALEKSDEIIVLSEFSKKYLVDKYLIDEEKIRVIPGGVDEKVFSPLETDKIELRKRLQLPVDKKIIVTTRRLVARMGLENLIFAIRELHRQKVNVFLMIVGEGFLRPKLEEIVALERLNEVVALPGAKDMREIPDYYRAADLFVMPSEYAEWFGLSTLEALSCGTLALGTPAGATGEILLKLDERLIFKDASFESIKNGIGLFLNDELRMRIAAKTREFVLNNYTWMKVFEKVEAVFIGELDRDKT